MRISLSVIFGALFSFFLLVAMTRLVTTTDLPPGTGSHVMDDNVTLPAPPPVRPEQPVKTLPNQPAQQSTPRIPGLTIDVDEHGTEIISLPPGVDGPGVIRERPDFGPFTPDNRQSEQREPGTADMLQPIQQFPPQYPREQAARGVEGWVTLSFDVRQDGTVGNIQVRDSKPRGAFEEAARNAIQRWRYQPGLSSPAQQSVTLDFILEN